MPKPCLVCGSQPLIVSTIHGTYYVICNGHAETYTKHVRDDAVAAWNAYEFEPPAKPISRVHHFRPLRHEVACGRQRGRDSEF